MQFHTELISETLPCQLGLNSQIVTLGSCFADVMGTRLAESKLTVLNNPLGTIFNPVSISKLVTMALTDAEPAEDGYLERDGIWFDYDFHSSFWAYSREELQALLIQTLRQTGDALRRADFLLLTLGSAMVYRHKQTGSIVANCHKMPGQLFEKYLYQIDHLRDELTSLVRTLHRANPTLSVILTVSPVRHTRDTLPVNQASKSMLRVLTHELTTWRDTIHYFPAYELMMDDLRDYRFYEADLIHPNAQAHDYIFGKFAESAFDTELRTFIAEWRSVRQALMHRPQHGGTTPADRQFLNRLQAQLEKLAKQVDTSAELCDVRSRLTRMQASCHDEPNPLNA